MTAKVKVVAGEEELVLSVKPIGSKFTVVSPRRLRGEATATQIATEVRKWLISIRRNK